MPKICFSLALGVTNGLPKNRLPVKVLSTLTIRFNSLLGRRHLIGLITPSFPPTSAKNVCAGGHSSLYLIAIALVCVACARKGRGMGEGSSRERASLFALRVNPNPLSRSCACHGGYESSLQFAVGFRNLKVMLCVKWKIHSSVN